MDIFRKFEENFYQVRKQLGYNSEAALIASAQIAAELTKAEVVNELVVLAKNYLDDDTEIV